MWQSVLRGAGVAGGLRASRRWSTWVVGGLLLVGVQSAYIYAQGCINPPSSGGVGWRPGTAVKYSFVGTWSGLLRDCVEEGIAAWNSANSSTNNAFFTSQGGGSPQITLSMQNLGGTTGGGMTEPSRDGDGYTTGVGIQFNTNTDILFSCDGFRKVAMHEFGHSQGLDDTQGGGGSSVMNQMSGANDSGGNIPMYPTSCDVNAATWYQPSDPCAFGCPPGYTTNCVGDQQPDPLHCNCCINYSPILIDLSGNGFNMSSAGNGVWWTINDQGASIQIGWPLHADDVWLARDRNHNGLVDNGSELFGNTTRLSDGTIAEHGYAALADLDANNDGEIDRSDPGFASLLVWSDRNRDGASAADELAGVAAAGIRSLSVNFRESRRRDQWGNQFRYVSFVTLRGGRRVLSVDVYPVTDGPATCATR
jgi:hypothetical protein